MIFFTSQQELTSQSIISLNMKYSNKRTKFRIAGTVQRETPQVTSPILNVQ